MKQLYSVKFVANHWNLLCTPGSFRPLSLKLQLWRYGDGPQRKVWMNSMNECLYEYMYCNKTINIQNEWHDATKPVKQCPPARFRPISLESWSRFFGDTDCITLDKTKFQLQLQAASDICTFLDQYVERPKLQELQNSRLFNF